MRWQKHKLEVFYYSLLRYLLCVFIGIKHYSSIFATSFILHGCCLIVMATCTGVLYAGFGLSKNGHALNLASTNMKINGMTDGRHQHGNSKESGQYVSRLFQRICKYTRIVSFLFLQNCCKSCRIPWPSPVFRFGLEIPGWVTTSFRDLATILSDWL